MNPYIILLLGTMAVLLLKKWAYLNGYDVDGGSTTMQEMYDNTGEKYIKTTPFLTITDDKKRRWS